MTMQLHISDDVHHELLNWARWCWSGALPHPLPPSHCGSLEAGYRAPPQWEGDDARRLAVIRPNEPNARIVQSAWEQLPPRERDVLREEYPAALVPRAVVGRDAAARRLGIPVSWYEIWLQNGVREVEKAFDAIRA
jgi:DNA-directed RNA polymerase specialized sigma24 family protein